MIQSTVISHDFVYRVNIVIRNEPLTGKFSYTVWNAETKISSCLGVDSNAQFETEKWKAVLYVEEIELVREVADEEGFCADRRACF